MILYLLVIILFYLNIKKNVTEKFADNVVLNGDTLTIPYNVNITGDLKTDKSINWFKHTINGNTRYLGELINNSSDGANIFLRNIRNHQIAIRLYSEYGDKNARIMLYKNDGNLGLDLWGEERKLDVFGSVRIFNHKFYDSDPGDEMHKPLEFIKKYKDSNDRIKQHKWTFWHPREAYGKNSFMMYEYDQDNAGKECGGVSGEGARCHRRFTIYNNDKGDIQVNGDLNLDNGINMKKDKYINVGDFVLGRYPDNNYTEFAVKHKNAQWWEGIRVDNKGYLKVNDGLRVDGNTNLKKNLEVDGDINVPVDQFTISNNDLKDKIREVYGSEVDLKHLIDIHK